jgi:hypothetical protein
MSTLVMVNLQHTLLHAVSGFSFTCNLILKEYRFYSFTSIVKARERNPITALDMP